MSLQSHTGAPNITGIRVRNTDASGVGAVDSVLSVVDTSSGGQSFTFLFDLDGVAAKDATLVSTGGSTPSTHVGRLKIRMPDASSAWIPLYSTSGE